MDLPFGVLGIYGALVVWLAVLVVGVKRRAYGLPLYFGVGLLLVLNIRYLLEGPASAIAFFVGIYDVLDNLGVDASEGAAALAQCPDNACSVWGDRYVNHPSWGVAFHERFSDAPDMRSYMLYGHIACYTLVFVLMHIQLFRPGFGERTGAHRALGRIAFVLLTIGTACAVGMAAEHGSISEYGGVLSMYGFWFMSLCVYVPAVMGVVAIRRGDTEGHRVWMVRFIGGMWGSFWLFRVMLFVIGPLLRNWEAVALQICIWLSAPLGIAIAEVIRRRIDQRPDTTVLPV